MSYKCAERLAARNYRSGHEANAFKIGYVNGYNRNDREEAAKHSQAAHSFPNAWSAGYWEGNADARETG